MTLLVPESLDFLGFPGLLELRNPTETYKMLVFKVCAFSF